MKGEICVVGLSPQEIMDKFNVSRATAYRALKSGVVHPDYHKSTMNPGILLDPNNAIKISKAVFYKHFCHLEGVYNHSGDCMQEALLRMIELSGKSQDPKYFYAVACNAMRSYLQKWGVLKKNHSEVLFNEEKIEDDEECEITFH